MSNKRRSFMMWFSPCVLKTRATQKQMLFYWISVARLYRRLDGIRNENPYFAVADESCPKCDAKDWARPSPSGRRSPEGPDEGKSFSLTRRFAAPSPGGRGIYNRDTIW